MGECSWKRAVGKTENNGVQMKFKFCICQCGGEMRIILETDDGQAS